MQLSSGEPCSFGIEQLSEHRHNSLRQRIDFAEKSDLSETLFHLSSAFVGIAEIVQRHIFGYRKFKGFIVLKYRSEQRAVVLIIISLDIVAAQRYLSRGNIVKPHHQIDKR